MRDLVRLFLRLSVTGFGGPAAHIGLMRREVVERRGWLGDEEFVDLLGVTNLLPGPNSTEMAMHVGRERRGFAGLVVAGVCFIVPAALVVLALAVVYERYGTTPELRDVLAGVQPVVLVVVIDAVWKLGGAVWGRQGRAGGRAERVGLFVAATVAFALSLAGAHEVLVLLGVAAAWVAVRAAASVLPALTPWGWVLAVSNPATGDSDLAGLAWVFLKAGALLFGSGYVLVAYLEGDLVDDLGWLTETQLLDAVAVGQVTPGPVFTTATFIGYQLEGWAGAAVATVAVFLPAFCFVALAGPLVRRARSRPWTAAALDGVNAAAVGLMAAVCVLLADTAIDGPFTVAVAVAAAVWIFAANPNTAWPILVGAGAGLVRGWVT